MQATANLPERIRAFLATGPWAVAGASNERTKFGNKLLRCYRQHGYAPVYALNPRASEIEGEPAYATLAATPQPVRSLSIVTPPAISEALVEEAARSGVRHLWFQPGAESARAVERARSLGLGVISGGPCLLVELGFQDEVGDTAS